MSAQNFCTRSPLYKSHHPHLIISIIFNQKYFFKFKSMECETFFYMSCLKLRKGNYFVSFVFFMKPENLVSNKLIRVKFPL